MSAISSNGATINTNETTTVTGRVTVVTGSGALARVTVITSEGDSFQCNANEAHSAQGTGAASNSTGKPFGVGDFVTVIAIVTTISGSGRTAQLTITLPTSGATVTVTAKAVHHPQRN